MSGHGSLDGSIRNLAATHFSPIESKVMGETTAPADGKLPQAAVTDALKEAKNADPTPTTPAAVPQAASAALGMPKPVNRYTPGVRLENQSKAQNDGAPAQPQAVAKRYIPGVKLENQFKAQNDGAPPEPARVKGRDPGALLEAAPKKPASAPSTSFERGIAPQNAQIKVEIGGHRDTVKATKAEAPKTQAPKGGDYISEMQKGTHVQKMGIGQIIKDLLGIKSEAKMKNAETTVTNETVQTKAPEKKMAAENIRSGKDSYDASKKMEFVKSSDFSTDHSNIGRTGDHYKMIGQSENGNMAAEFKIEKGQITDMQGNSFKNLEEFREAKRFVKPVITVAQQKEIDNKKAANENNYKFLELHANKLPAKLSPADKQTVFKNFEKPGEKSFMQVGDKFSLWRRENNGSISENSFTLNDNGTVKCGDFTYMSVDDLNKNFDKLNPL